MLENLRFFLQIFATSSSGSDLTFSREVPLCTEVPRFKPLKIAVSMCLVEASTFNIQVPETTVHAAYDSAWVRL